MKVKKKVKAHFAKLVSDSESPIIVSSMGRSGSTMLTKSIAKSAIRYQNVVPHNRIIERLWKLRKQKLKKGLVYKTHDYPPKESVSGKFVYVYSDPYRVISSIYSKLQKEGKHWVIDHARKLKADPKEALSFLEKDSFNIESHFDAWHSADGLNLMLIRLSELWEKQHLLSEFLGFGVTLPQKRERKSSIDLIPKGNRKKIKKVYKNIRNKVISRDMEIKTNDN